MGGICSPIYVVEDRVNLTTKHPLNIHWRGRGVGHKVLATKISFKIASLKHGLELLNYAS